MKKWILTMLITMSSLSFASVPELVKDMACKKEIIRKMKTYTKTFDWQRTVNPESGIYAFKTPTSTFARWIELQAKENPEVIVYEIDKTRLLRWNAKTCENVFNNSFKPLSFLKKTKLFFNDTELEKLVRSKKFSLVYLWSPGMVYSVREMHTFAEITKKLGIKFIPVMDEEASFKDGEYELKKYNLKYKTRKLQSLEIFMRTKGLHYPISFLVGRELISERIFGVLPSEDLEARLSGLKTKMTGAQK